MRILAWYTFILVILTAISAVVTGNKIEVRLLGTLIQIPAIVFVLKYLGFI